MLTGHKKWNDLSYLLIVFKRYWQIYKRVAQNNMYVHIDSVQAYFSTRGVMNMSTHLMI